MNENKEIRPDVVCLTLVLDAEKAEWVEVNIREFLANTDTLRQTVSAYKSVKTSFVDPHALQASAEPAIRTDAPKGIPAGRSLREWICARVIAGSSERDRNAGPNYCGALKQ